MERALGIFLMAYGRLMIIMRIAGVPVVLREVMPPVPSIGTPAIGPRVPAPRPPTKLPVKNLRQVQQDVDGPGHPATLRLCRSACLRPLTGARGNRNLRPRSLLRAVRSRYAWRPGRDRCGRSGCGNDRLRRTGNGDRPVLDRRNRGRGFRSMPLAEHPLSGGRHAAGNGESRHQPESDCQ